MSAWTAFSATALAAAVGFFYPWLFEPSTWLRAAGIAALIVASGALAQSGLSLARGGRRPEHHLREAIVVSMRTQPGALAVVLVVSFDLFQRGFLSFDVATARPTVGCALQALVLLWLVQGIGSRIGARASGDAQWRRWRDREAYSRALGACERRLDELVEQASLSPDAAVVFRRALERSRGLHALEVGASAEAIAEMEQQRWTEALRGLLFEARLSLRRSCEEGTLSESAAARLERELLRRWHAADELSVEEAFVNPLDDDAS